jgi:hypothetical protein
LAACVGHSGPLPPRVGVRYAAALDVGLKHDRTVLVVGHRESSGKVVVDRLQRWQGSKARPVPLTEVEAAVFDVHALFGGPRLVADPWQWISSAQRLRAKGVRIDEFAFTTMSVGRIAGLLHRLIRDRALDLPDDPVLLDELAAVRLRLNSANVVRLDHASGGHDDHAVALGLLAHALLEATTGGPASVIGARGSLPSGGVPNRTRIGLADHGARLLAGGDPRRELTSRRLPIRVGRQ